MHSSKLIDTEEYQSFRSSVALRKIAVDADLTKAWKLYDAGPRNIVSPIICLPPAGARAEVFFRQIMVLSSLNYRVIAVDYPPYWNVDDFCVGFRKLLDNLSLKEVHLFGCALGGFLAMKFAERTSVKKYVSSLILCNSFADTSVFNMSRLSAGLWTLPSFILRRLFLGKFASGLVDMEQADAIDFVVDGLDTLSQKELSSRLRLRYSGEYVRYPQVLQNVPITVIDVLDEVSLPEVARDTVSKCFPHSKVAHLKTGGSFPFLSRTSETNLHLRLHLRQFEDKETNGTKT